MSALASASGWAWRRLRRGFGRRLRGRCRCRLGHRTRGWSRRPSGVGAGVGLAVGTGVGDGVRMGSSNGVWLGDVGRRRGGRFGASACRTGSRPRPRSPRRRVRASRSRPGRRPGRTGARTPRQASGPPRRRRRRRSSRASRRRRSGPGATGGMAAPATTGAAARGDPDTRMRVGRRMTGPVGARRRSGWPRRPGRGRSAAPTIARIAVSYPSRAHVERRTSRSTHR